MSAPTVTAICLTKDRPEMLARAVRCFQAQTYENKRLLIVNTGQGPLIEETDTIWEPCFVGADALSIGELRNLGNKYAAAHYMESWTKPEIFVHWDDDDLSHPNRIEEQVALLQASGADCVGYSDLLFWDTREICSECRVSLGGQHLPRCHRQGLVTNASDYRDGGGEAWLYLGPQKALGTSLAYWRRVWQAKPFPDQPRPGFAGGEDAAFIKGLNLCSISSLGSLDSLRVTAIEGEPDNGWRTFTPGPETMSGEPRMVASIHGRNTSGSYKLMDNSDSWRRVSNWDSFCRERMAL